MLPVELFNQHAEFKEVILIVSKLYINFAHACTMNFGHVWCRLLMNSRRRKKEEKKR